MNELARKGRRCPVCQKGTVVQRITTEGKPILGCSTYNPKNPRDPQSDSSIWNMDGTLIVLKSSRMTIVYGMLLSVVFVVILFFVFFKVFN
jgi:hypothetical protein